MIPEHMGDAMGKETIPGQKCVFLVVVTDEGSESGKGNAVNISATAPGATVAVEPETITPGQVAEVTVMPDEASIDKTLTVTVHGERDGLEQTETGTIKVVKFYYDPELLIGLASTALAMSEKFIPWLAANHPELGIISETEWNGIMIRPLNFIVSFYLFFSEDWEMGMTWHVTTPPSDWARIYLRHRFTEAHPSYAFEISSWSTESEEPHAIDLEDPIYNISEVWR